MSAPTLLVWDPLAALRTAHYALWAAVGLRVRVELDPGSLLSHCQVGVWPSLLILPTASDPLPGEWVDPWLARYAPTLLDRRCYMASDERDAQRWRAQMAGMGVPHAPLFTPPPPVLLMPFLPDAASCDMALAQVQALAAAHTTRRT